MKDASTDFSSLQLPGLDDVRYTAEYRSNQNPKIELRPEGVFRVILPSQDASPEEFLMENKDWIHEQQSQLSEKIEKLAVDLDQMLEKFVLWGEPFDLREQRGSFDISIRQGSIDVTTPNNRDEMAYLKNWVKDILREEVTSSARNVADEIGVDFDKVYIRNQETKWASCSSRGNLSFNIRCAFLPPEHLQYLVAHEVAHLKHPHHGDSFWDELESIGVDYRRGKEELDGFWILSNQNQVWQQLLSRY